MKKYYILTVLLLLFTSLIKAQIKYNNVERQLDTLSVKYPQLKDNVQFDVSGLNLYELLTTIADVHKINISVDPELNYPVISTFYDIQIKDILAFLIQKYDLNFSVYNQILIFKKQEIPLPKIEPKKSKEIDITYQKHNDFLSVNLRNDSLSLVAKKIIDLTERNVILSPNTKNLKISSYIKNRPFEQVIQMMAKSNGLKITLDQQNFYYVEVDNSPSTPTSVKKNEEERRSTGNLVKLTNEGFITVKSEDINVYDLIREVADKLNINYFFYDKPDRLSASLSVNSITFEELLSNVFEATEYSYAESDGYFLIGKNDTKGIRSTQLIQLENRTIESVKSSIPKNLSRDLMIEDFVELNGLVVTGSKPKIEELSRFVKLIDKVVPLVQIEVLIVNYQKGYDLSTGITAGVKETNQTTPKTNGTLLPNYNMNMDGSSVNKLIDAFNGLGTFNIGKVTQNFYLNLQALEKNSIIDVHSTPKIATLSGHEATVSIGETNYYFEQSNSLINSGINNNILQSGQWKSTEANLSVKIKPFVSKDEYVTLTIVVEQSTFLPRTGQNAPPGKTTQKFDALIRVKNGEMVLLGGLEEVQKGNSGNGIPWIARIPVLKWFLSSRTKSQKKSKLHVFIKPTIAY